MKIISVFIAKVFFFITSTISIVLSVEPSSTTIISNSFSEIVCFERDINNSLISSNTLY